MNSNGARATRCLHLDPLSGKEQASAGAISVALVVDTIAGEIKTYALAATTSERWCTLRVQEGVTCGRRLSS